MADPLPPHGGAGGGGGGGTASAAEWQAKSPVHYRTYTNAKDKSVLLRKAAGESKTEIDGLDDDVSALQGAIAGHANALSMYKHQIRVKEEECRELSQDLKASRAEAEHLRAKLRGAEECTSHAEAGRRKAVAAAAAAEEDASNKEARAKDLQLRLEGLDAELCAANQRVCSADTETAELRRRLMGAEAAAETAQSKADALAHQLSGVQEQMQDVAHANATMERRAVEDQHKMIELGSLLKRSEAAQEQLQSKLARADATVQELRRDSGEITRLKMALGEAKRATHAALTSKNGVGIELARAEDALHAALAEGTLSERLRDEAFAAHALHDAAAAKLAACEEALLRAQAEVEGLGLRCEAAERHAAEEEKARARLQEDMGMLAHDAKALHDNETLRRADDAELEALRAEVCERRTQCEELAMGVEQLHQKLERESAQRVELEAVRDELLALERSGAAGSKATLQQLVDDRSVLEQQLAQVVGTLDMLWGELAPAVCLPSFVLFFFFSLAAFFINMFINVICRSSRGIKRVLPPRMGS